MCNKLRCEKLKGGTKSSLVVASEKLKFKLVKNIQRKLVVKERLVKLPLRESWVI